MESKAMLLHNHLNIEQQNGDSRPVVVGLSVCGITVVYDHHVVLERLSLDAGEGEWLTLLGNSGCGKTTLLRAVAGFVRPQEGQILMGQRDLVPLPAHKRQVGFVHQNYALFPHMTVFQNVAFGLWARRTRRTEMARRVGAALQTVRLNDAGHLYPSQLSGGMQQRVALARSLVLEPRLLLLDEPLSALDTNLRVELRNELKALHDRHPNLTVIYVTHDREEAMTLSHRIALLRDGAIEQLGTPEELYNTPANGFVARYLGTVNVLPDILASFLLTSNHDAGKEFYLRPEHIRIGAHGPVTLSGVVAESEWLGSYHRLRVKLSDHPDSTFIVEARQADYVPCVGDSTVLSFRPEDCIHV